MLFPFTRICVARNTARVAVLTLLSLLSLLSVYAQSTDVRFPTLVDGNEIVGAIPARDVGDARLTDHFYTFNGLPGDLLITVESKNLNGDFDVFTAAELRPVLKVSVYAETSTAVTKNIYLRRSESLILRVEARTPNDDEGNYRIRFSGSFAPLDNRLLAADSGTRTEEGTSQPSRTGDRKANRVSSAGARIDESATEVSATRKPPAKEIQTDPNEGMPEKTAAETVRSTDADATSKPAADSMAIPETSAVIKRPAARRPSPRRGANRNSRTQPTAESGRLIIEVKDGSRIEYLMSTVTRFTVENGEIVIVSEDGYTKRVPLTNVLKVSIGP
jgi:hypothetical protein